VSRVDPPLYDPALVIVRMHALQRARQRIVPEVGWGDGRVKNWVVSRVLAALERGQVFTEVPRHFRAPMTRSILVPPWQRVLIDGDAGFIVDVALQPKLEVVTVIRKAHP